MVDNRIAYRAYKDAASHSDDLFQLFDKLYSLPIINYEEELTDASLFEYVVNRAYFTVIVPYTDRKEVVLERAFGFGKLAWSMIGGGVKPHFGDNFVDAARRHAGMRMPGVDLGELEPVAILRNVFSFQGETHQHQGVAFIGRVRSRDALQETIVSEGTRVQLVADATGVSSFSLSQHQDLMPFALERISHSLEMSPQDEEIDANEEHQARYRFHDAVVKPAFGALSKMFGEKSIPDFYKVTDEQVFEGSPTSILDVSCGENYNFITSAVNAGLELVVGNDISWSQVQLISEKFYSSDVRGSNTLVNFTNHDARNLPFKDKSFDVVLCKNTLHHMPNVASVRSMVAEVVRVGKKSVIVDVLDPSCEGWWGRQRHKYYMRFLKDAGNNFLDRDEFRQVVSLSGALQPHFFEVNTIRATYQFGVIAP